MICFADKVSYSDCTLFCVRGCFVAVRIHYNYYHTLLYQNNFHKHDEDNRAGFSLSSDLFLFKLNFLSATRGITAYLFFISDPAKAWFLIFDCGDIVRSEALSLCIKTPNMTKR